MTPINLRKAAFEYERNNRDASLHEAFIQGYLWVSKEEMNKNKSDDPYIFVETSFDDAWRLYDRKDNKQSAIKAWNKLTDAEKEKAIYHIPAFVEARPDKQYRPMLSTYLNQKRFNDEEIISNGKTSDYTKAQQRFADYAEAINYISREG